MRTYIKNLRETATVDRATFRLDIRHLDFTFFLHPNSLAFVAEAARLGPEERLRRISVVADIAASAYAQSAHRRHFPRQLVDRGMEYTDRMIQDRGFRLEYEGDLVKSLAADESELILFVPGCQTRVILRSRGRAAYDVDAALGSKFRRIVCSGRNSIRRPFDTAAVLNESAELAEHFAYLAKRDRKTPPSALAKIETEAESRSTIDNVNEFLDRYVATSRHALTIVAVSSLFHLPRLGDALTAAIHARSMIHVDRLVLVSAEGLQERSPATRDPNYVKSTYYEVFAHLLSAKDEYLRVSDPTEGSPLRALAG